MTPSTGFDLGFYVGREEKFWGNFLTLFFFVLNSFQGGIKFSEWPALQWTYPPLICGLPISRWKPPLASASPGQVYGSELWATARGQGRQGRPFIGCRRPSRSWPEARSQRRQAQRPATVPYSYPHRRAGVLALALVRRRWAGNWNQRRSR